MDVLVEAFRMGGVWMYLILAACILGWPLALIGLAVGLISKNSKVAIVGGAVVLAIGLGTAGLGTIGYVSELGTVEAALEKATPANRERLRQKGQEIANYSLYFGLGGGSVPLLMGLVTLGAGIVRRGDT